MRLQLGTEAAAGEVMNCPTNIIGLRVDSVRVVGDGCLISDAIIEDGDVEVKEVNNFEIRNSTVQAGDIVVEDVNGVLIRK